MFQTLFATMNEVLEDIRLQYPNAHELEKSELLDQLEALKAMSDVCIEHWIDFEENMGIVQSELQMIPDIASTSTMTDVLGESHANPQLPKLKLSEEILQQFEKGQGYFRLSMYEQALLQFQSLVDHQPDWLQGRTYLALCYFVLGELEEASRHFQFIIPLAHDGKTLAISYHALACIYMMWDLPEQADQYFALAANCDPSLHFYSLS